jgi:hypothetical protein
MAKSSAVTRTEVEASVRDVVRSRKLRLTQGQFAEIVAKMHAMLFLKKSKRSPASSVPATDCIAIEEFIKSAQAIWDRDCAIVMTQATKKPIRKSK